VLDPVARHRSTGGESAEANVKPVWVVRRALKPDLAATWEGLIGIGPNPMRPSSRTTARVIRGRLCASVVA